jgi:general secretion pathway protein I
VTTRSRGFTLVEVMVALAVLAIALPALLFAINEQVSGLNTLREKSVAHWIASDRMTQLRLQNHYRDFLPSSRRRGDVELLGRTWYWEETTEKTANDQLLQVDITVRAEDETDAPALASLSAFFSIPQQKLR